MLRLFTNRTSTVVAAASASRRRIHLSPYRLFSSPQPCRNPEKSIDYPKDVTNTNRIPPPPILHHRNPLSYAPSSLSRTSVLAFSATLVSAIAASLAIVAAQDSRESGQKSSRIYEDFQHAIDRSNESFRRIVNTMKQTGVAASVLSKSLWSVLSSANQEVRLGFEVRVAALLADIAAANESRRQALVGAGGGVVLDWLLDTVAVAGDNSLTQAESARALAYLIADPNVCQVVLGRPNAVPNLLRFIFSAQPQAQLSKKQPRRSSFDISDSLKGRSMLVAAIMDIVTSNCDIVDVVGLKPVLPGNAAMRDISAAIQVIEEGGMHLDEKPGSEEDDDDGKGIKGIGIKVLGGTSVLGLSRTTDLMAVDHSNASHLESDKHAPKTLLFNKVSGNSPGQNNVSSSVIPGLWDDLLSQHVAVPFAAWALANWAMASDVNRSHIQELDQDGYAVMMALTAPERSVKWHGSLVARLLLEDQNLPLNDSVSDWSSSLLSTVSQASKTDDIPLTQVALSAFLLSLERSPVAQKVVMEKGLPLMREIAKRTIKHRSVQEALAKGLESLSTGEMHLSLDEGQKWSGTLLSWVFGETSTDNLRTSAIKILSHILEDYGPSALPISQGWLAILLSEILESQKMASLKGSAHSKSDKVKTQIDQANIVSATQSANQLAGAVLHLAVHQLGKPTDSDDSFPLEDIFSNEPFVGPKKNLKKDSIPKINAADSALATLKGIKSLTEICSEDSLCQNKVADYGVLSLLRRLLLRDDYEKLAANEAYDASREMEAQERTSKVPSESSAVDASNPSSVRVAPSAHIRRHAARFLTILSVLPKVKKVIIADKSWCEWLEECANGKIPGCNDPKTQSYARAILLNIFCNDQDGRNPVNNDGPDSSASSKTSTCPHYTEMIYLINPDLPHWKCPEKKDMDSAGGTTMEKLNPVNSSLQRTEGSIDGETSPITRADDEDNSSFSTSTSQGHSSKDPPLDVVFVHGLRGGPFKTWRLSDDKSSTKSGLVEKIDEEAGRQGTFWPGEWLSADFPNARLFTLKYKTNLTQWSGSSLPLQEVSSMLLEKLVAAGIGDRPVVFVTHSMGGLVVKQMLYQAKSESKVNLVDNTVGVVFYSCPHFGSKLADMPWRMGFVLRPAPSIGELRSGSPRLVQLNDYIRNLHKKGLLEVLSFCETKVTPIVEGYGGWAFRMEIVPIESAYPGFGELVVLDSTDHVNSCKPLDRCDPSYKETLDFLRKLKAEFR